MPCSLVFWLDENFCNNPNCLVLTPKPVRQKLDPLQCNIREPTHRKQVILNIVQWPTIIESYVGETYTLRNSIYKVTNRALFYAYCSAWLTTNFIRVDNCPFPCVPVRVAATDIDFSDLKKKIIMPRIHWLFRVNGRKYIRIVHVHYRRLQLLPCDNTIPRNVRISCAFLICGPLFVELISLFSAIWLFSVQMHLHLIQLQFVYLYSHHHLIFIC